MPPVHDKPAPVDHRAAATRPSRLWRRRRSVVVLPLGLFVIVACRWAWQASEPFNIDHRPEFKGRPIGQVLNEFGRPALAQQFRVEDAAQVAYRSVAVSEAYPAYRASDAPDAVVPIRELTWNRGRSRLTVWFHRVGGTWVALDAVATHKRMRWPLEAVPTTMPADRDVANLVTGH